MLDLQPLNTFTMFFHQLFAVILPFLPLNFVRFSVSAKNFTAKLLFG